MATDNNNKILNFSNKREQNEIHFDYAEREKIQGKNFLNVPNKGNVPRLRFVGYTDEWKNVKIADIATIVGGGTPDTTISEYWDGDIQWFTPSEIGKSKYIAKSDRTITNEGLINSSAKILPKGTILLSTRATIGECSIANQECCTNQGFQSIIAKNNTTNEFQYYLIQTKKKDLIRNACGSTFLEISANEVRKIRCNIPNIEEQRKIADFLSLLDKRIETQNKIIEDLKKLKVAIRDKQLNIIRKQYGLNTQVLELLDYEQPTKYIVSNTEYLDDDNLIPVLTANKAFILGYTDEPFGIYDKGQCIILDDFTLDCKLVNFAFKIKSSAIKILTPKNGISLRYVYEYLNHMDLETTEHKRHYISEIEPMLIAYPESNIVINSFCDLMEIYDKKIEIENKYLQSLLSQKSYLLRNMFI